ncbi:MAG: hypothetical protein K9G27_04210 [Sphingomonadaceae bacterium]|uniref:hypothetical protein n=1 Tax=Sphingorhabdus sp. TaxID=1902408 RepID=UPI002FDB3BB4|nr:hypothetical protein [Sphingomonadaceae bacterium]
MNFEIFKGHRPHIKHNVLPNSWSLSKWLAVKTSHARDLVIGYIETYQPVMSEINYQRLLLAHEHYHQLVKPVYDDPNIKRLIFPFSISANRRYLSLKRPEKLCRICIFPANVAANTLGFFQG